jgi:hypothetical protein
MTAISFQNLDTFLQSNRKSAGKVGRGGALKIKGQTSSNTDTTSLTRDSGSLTVSEAAAFVEAYATNAERRSTNTAGRRKNQATQTLAQKEGSRFAELSESQLVMEQSLADMKRTFNTLIESGAALARGDLSDATLSEFKAAGQKFNSLLEEVNTTLGQFGLDLNDQKQDVAAIADEATLEQTVASASELGNSEGVAKGESDSFSTIERSLKATKNSIEAAKAIEVTNEVRDIARDETRNDFINEQETASRKTDIARQNLLESSGVSQTLGAVDTNALAQKFSSKQIEEQTPGIRLLKNFFV